MAEMTDDSPQTATSKLVERSPRTNWLFNGEFFVSLLSIVLVQRDETKEGSVFSMFLVNGSVCMTPPLGVKQAAEFVSSLCLADSHRVKFTMEKKVPPV